MSDPDFLAFFVGSPDFQSGSARHSVPQRSDLASGDIDDIHVEKFDFRKRHSVQFLENLRSIGTLNLVTVTSAHDRFPFRV